MKRPVFFLVLLLYILALPSWATEQKESVYDRVMRTGTIRCGYALWPTYFEVDPNTRVFSGIWYEYMNQVGKLLDLKIDWVEESGFGEINAALENNRYDVFCSGLWQDIRRAKGVDFVDPITFQGVVVVARHDDKRFDNKLTEINDPAVKVVTIDGEMSEIIQRTDYPKASAVSLPQLTDASQFLMQIVTKKADVTFTSPETVKRFIDANPNTLRIVPTENPLRLFAEVLVVKSGEDRLRRILSQATFELLNNGTIESILQKYEKYPGSFYRVAKPYEAHQ